VRATLNGIFDMIGDFAQSGGTVAAAGLQYMGTKAQADAGTDQVKEYMKNKRFLARSAATDFKNQLISAKQVMSSTAASNASDTVASTTRQRNLVLYGIAAAAILGVGGAIFMIARRT